MKYSGLIAASMSAVLFGATSCGSSLTSGVGDPPVAVASVSVALSTATSTVGQPMFASAVVRDANGNVLSGRAIFWSSSNAAVASISGAADITPLAAGTTEITATSEGKSGRATLSVAAPASVAVASVSVTLASEVVAGQTTQATATTRDAANNILTGRTITWSSNDGAVASVSASGMVSTVAAGSALITATSEGKSGSAGVTVTAPMSFTACTPTQPGWIWCDDFETDRIASYFEYDAASGSFARAGGIGKDGSTGMRVRFAAGQVSAGALRLAFGKGPGGYVRPVDAGTAIYREIYWRMYVKNQVGWTGGGGDKLSRATSLVSSDWKQAMIAHVWSGSDNTNWYKLGIDPASGTDPQGNLVSTKYNDFANLRWLGSAGSITPMFDAAHVGVWHCVEAHARLNDAGSSNGLFELWIDGAAEAQRSGLNWVGSYSTFGINAVFFENYWNAGSPVAQERYFDNIVVSTQRIGC